MKKIYTALCLVLFSMGAFSQITLYITKVDIACYGSSNGAADVTVIGGTPPYSYNWSNGDTTEDLSFISAGLYCVTVTDANSNSATDCVTITQPATPFTATITKTNLSCYGVCTGIAECNPSGGDISCGGYTYMWNYQNNDDSMLVNVCAGVYTVTVTDCAGCSAVGSAIVTQPPQQAPLIFDTFDVLCYGECTGEIDLTLCDITTYDRYLWSNGDTTQDIFNLCAGYYSVTVTNDNGCTKSAGAIIHQPLSPLQDSIILKNVSCHDSADGCINLVVYGGTPPYSCQWNDGSTTPPCNISVPWDSIEYKVTITDANGCEKTDSVTVYQPPAPLIVSATANPINGIAPLTVNFTYTGSGATTFLWDFGDGSPTSSQQDPAHTFNNPGTFTVVLNAGSGLQFDCYDTAKITITVTPSGIATQPDINTAIEIFPNPVNDMLYIQTNLKLHQTEITDIIGKTVLTTKEKNIPFSKYPCGIYIIKVTTDAGIITKKFMKE